jgi:16S rRNA G966 N2-methylase RsmD
MEKRVSKKLKKIGRIFPRLEDVGDISKLKIDKVGEYSISIPEDALKTTKIILQIMNTNDIIITDATAGVGGNTISFAENFKLVNSIELDSIRFEYLKNNLSIYNKRNVKLYNSDFLQIISLLKQDVVFIDPPWGGKDYKSKGEIILNVSNISLEKICNNILYNNYAKMVVLKLPINYNTKYLNKNIEYVTHYYKLRNKMSLVCITSNKKVLIV